MKDNVLRLCEYLYHTGRPLDASWNDELYFVPERGMVDPPGMFFLSMFSDNLKVVRQWHAIHSGCLVSQECELTCKTTLLTNDGEPWLARPPPTQGQCIAQCDINLLSKSIDSRERLHSRHVDRQGESRSTTMRRAYLVSSTNCIPIILGLLID